MLARGCTPPGALDLLVLATLANGSKHGQGLAVAITRNSHGVIVVRYGSLHPALQRLKARGWVRAVWGASENRRRARFFELTSKGRKQLAREALAWRQVTGAVSRILDRGREPPRIKAS